MGPLVPRGLSRDPGTRFRRAGTLLFADPSATGGAPRLDDLRVLCPCLVPLSAAGARLYYQGHGRASPPGTEGLVLSARLGADGVLVREPGVRIGVFAPDVVRVLAPDVLADGHGGFVGVVEVRFARRPSRVHAVRSRDGLAFDVAREPLLAERGAAFGSPRLWPLADGTVRVLAHRYPEPFRSGVARQNHVVSARWDAPDAAPGDERRGAAWDAGGPLAVEPGVRVGQEDAARENEAVYALSPTRLPDGSVLAFYAAWNGAKRERGVLAGARSADQALTFAKVAGPVLEGPVPDAEALFVSEPCLAEVAPGEAWLVYEASDLEGRTAIRRARAALR